MLDGAPSCVQVDVAAVESEGSDLADSGGTDLGTHHVC